MTDDEEIEAGKKFFIELVEDIIKSSTEPEMISASLVADRSPNASALGAGTQHPKTSDSRERIYFTAR